MEPKLMKRVGTFVMGTFALFNVVTLFLVNRFPIGDLSYGEYSIYASKGFFMAYHIWGIVLCVVCIYAMWKEIRLLFMVTLLLLIMVMFYPYFTSSPSDRKAGAEKQKTSQRQENVPESNHKVPTDSFYMGMDSLSQASDPDSL